MSHVLLAIVLAVTGEISNPNIDMPGYLRVAHEAAAYRVDRRVSEEEFLRLSCEPGAVILDARSSEKYRELHVKGAINLSFPDITAASLRAESRGDSSGLCAAAGGSRVIAAAAKHNAAPPSIARVTACLQV